MKYVAILNTDDEFSEDTINILKATFFMGGAKGTQYCFDFDSIKEVPEMMKTELRDDIGIKDIKSRYNQALWDCGVRKEN